VKYHRNDEALRDALATHTVDGMDVIVPIFGEAEIIDQGATGPVRHISPGSVELGNPYIYYRVKPKKPFPFDGFLRARYPSRVIIHRLEEQMPLSTWEAVFERKMPPIPDYLMTKLENGGTLSISDLEYDSLLQRGCIDENNSVTCYTFWSSQADMVPQQLRRGSLVEYVYGTGNERMSYPGSILGFTKDKEVAYLELFTPMPFLDLPDSIWLEGLEESFYSPYTHALGYGSYEALEIAEQESGEKLIPPGTWDTDVIKERKLYTLKEFIPISIVKDLCEAAYGNEPHCFWQSLIVYVVPIDLHYVGEKGERGTWHPLPEKVVSVDAVISYEDEDEG